MDAICYVYDFNLMFGFAHCNKSQVLSEFTCFWFFPLPKSFYHLKLFIVNLAQHFETFQPTFCGGNTVVVVVKPKPWFI